MKLRFSTKDPQLSREQIEGLAHQLPTACENAGITVHRIDWIKMESTSTPTSSTYLLPGLVHSVTAVNRMRRRSQSPLRSNLGSNSDASPIFKRRRTNDMSPTVKIPSLSLTVHPQAKIESRLTNHGVSNKCGGVSVSLRLKRQSE